MKYYSDGNEGGYEISNIDTVFGDGYSPYFAGAMKLSNNRYLNVLKYHLPDDPNHFGNAQVVVDSLISLFYDTLHLAGYALTLKKIEKTNDGKYLTGGYDVPYDEIQAYLNKVYINPLSFDTMYTTPYTYDSLCTENIVYADTIYFDDCLNVGDKEFANDYKADHPLHLYPNPTKEELTVSLRKLSYEYPINITIHTFTGKVKWQGLIEEREQSKRISVFSWPKGIYIITARKGIEIIGREKVIVM
ncbi:MAG: hypothetical protein C0593_04470 [Marinilabiliales bacterium]|nr:MAG: hypothetical protein C0593_04470 [Marinilabiliales bacterium]